MAKSRKPREAGDCGWRWASCSYVPYCLAQWVVAAFTVGYLAARPGSRD